jgi:hypothetical protein
MSVAFSPDSRTLASTEGNGVHLWEIATGKERARITCPTKEVHAVAFSADGRLLAAGGWDGNIWLWDLATGEELARFAGHTGSLRGLAFSPDGRFLVSAGGVDTTGLVWDVAGLQVGGPTGKNTSTEQEWLWSELGEDAQRAYRALWRLAAVPQESVPFLQKRIQNGPPVNAQRLANLIAELDSERFAVRAQASTELEKLGLSAEPHLRTAYQGRSSLEVRRRAGLLLEKLDRQELPVEQLRRLRALEALERCGTPAARTAVEAVARGPEPDWLAGEARRVLQVGFKLR